MWMETLTPHGRRHLVFIMQHYSLHLLPKSSDVWMLNQRFWLPESSMTKLKWFSLDYLWIRHFSLIFRYQRLVPGRENIAAEHLVPQLGYVATSKTIILLQLVHYLNGRLYTFKCHRPIFTVLLSRFKTIWTVFTAKHIKLDGVWHVSHLQVMVRW